MTEGPKYNPLAYDTPEFAGKIARRLQRIYKSGFHEGLVNRILAMASSRFTSWPEWTEKDILLITYGNTIRSDNQLPLQSLHNFLKEKLADVISCVHILPFFPYTSDDGFAVSNFLSVNPALGSWDDIAALNKDFCLMTDLVINHVSSAHPWFKNFLENRSPGKDYFIRAEAGTDYSSVVRPRSSALFTRFTAISGEEDIWTTFSTDQVDLNFSNPEVLLEMIRVMIFYINKGARFIRLDAIAFLWKCAGTLCLHLDETHEIVKLLRDIATYIRPGTVVLTETNVPNRENWSYFGNGDEAHMVYQFSLPPLLLYTFFSGNSSFLNRWAAEIPDTEADQTFLNYTASHDGIGVRPLEGLLPHHELKVLIGRMEELGGLISMKANSDGTLSPYEINITWFDAMKGTKDGLDDLHESRFICSQTVMMSLKGIPAFYIHSLLATPNDYRGVENTGRYRSINRKQMDRKELEQLLETDTTQKRIYEELTRLIRIRKSLSAFHPSAEQQILAPGEGYFAFRRYNPLTGQVIYCIANITPEPCTLAPFLPGVEKPYDLITGDFLPASDPVTFKPYQMRWVEER